EDQQQEGGCGEETHADPAELRADLQLGLDELDLLGDQGRDVPARIADQTADGGISVLDRFRCHDGNPTQPVRGDAHHVVRCLVVSREVWSARGYSTAAVIVSSTPR